jgi:3-oxoacyl-[acyl-carrier protein] reductase
MKANDMFDLTGEVALVTGSSSGLGLRFAGVLAANGAKVALVARRVERLESLKKTIEAAGGKAIAIEADVLDHKAMTRAYDTAEKAFGTVTILVNNAGIAHTDRALELSEETWRSVLATNLDAVFFWSQEGGKRMIAANKHGAVQITKALALELAFKGVRVNAIAPGWFVTEINDEFLASEKGQEIKRAIPMGRFGQAGDLDGALLLLASKAGAFMTGATLVVDGGQVVQLR